MTKRPAPPPENYAVVTREVDTIPLAYPQPVAWAVCFGASLVLFSLFVIGVGATFRYGIGMWGNDIPVSWGIAISNYIWFLGIGHAGTLISALLLLTGTSRRADPPGGPAREAPAARTPRGRSRRAPRDVGPATRRT